MTPAALLAALAVRIRERAAPGILRVGIDGVDGAGKTTFADRLAQVLEAIGVVVIRASVDGFHNPRDVRYARGKESPEGFYRDSYDYAAFRRELIEPLGPGGSGRYRRAVFDVKTDQPVDKPLETAPRAGVLLVDGIFLHRPELRGAWDLTVFLDVPFEQSFRRMAQRDGSDPNPLSVLNRRYFLGQKLYLDECTPQTRASILVDYADYDAPRIERG
jgi:uridine kinase